MILEPEELEPNEKVELEEIEEEELEPEDLEPEEEVELEELELEKLQWKELEPPTTSFIAISHCTYIHSVTRCSDTLSSCLRSPGFFSGISVPGYDPKADTSGIKFVHN